MAAKMAYNISLLHARGGVSMQKSLWTSKRLSSPRSWRCFFSTAINICYCPVFSTLVEVFLGNSMAVPVMRCLLHARGGVSGLDDRKSRYEKSSPRSWRCFSSLCFARLVYAVFSTLVEVFLGMAHGRGIIIRLLHARGGVSYTVDPEFGAIESSPRSWRCFSRCSFRR